MSLFMKEKLGGINAMYPIPTTLAGATVNGKSEMSRIKLQERG